MVRRAHRAKRFPVLDHDEECLERARAARRAPPSPSAPRCGAVRCAKPPIGIAEIDFSKHVLQRFAVVSISANTATEQTSQTKTSPDARSRSTFWARDRFLPEPWRNRNAGEVHGNVKKVKTNGRYPASIGSSSNRPRASSTSFSGNCRAKFGSKLKNLSETQRHCDNWCANLIEPLFS